MTEKGSDFSLKEIFNLINESQHSNEKSTMELIIMFNPLIQKYSRKLNYDGADTDLITFILEIIPNIPIFKESNMQNDGCLVNYICNSIKHKFVYLSKKNNKIISMETELNTDILIQSYEEPMESNLFISSLLGNLSRIQKQIIKKIFIQDISENTISKQLNISRQAVNRTKNRALKVLRNNCF